MVGCLHSPLTEKAATIEKENQNIQPSYDSKQSSSLNYSLELCLPELDDFTSFPDYIDFDSLNGWLTEGDHNNMTDLGGNPVEFEEDKVELGVPKESLQVVRSVEEEFSGEVKPLVDMTQEKCEVGVVERGVETEANGVSEKGLSVEGTSDKSGNLGVLIEEKLGKVSLDGPKYIVEFSGIGENGVNVQNEIKISCGETKKLNEENIENDGEKGNKEDAMGVNEKQSEKDAGESQSDSESESESSSSSSSDDEDEDEDDEEEESGDVTVKKKAKNKERRVEGEIDVEEGEIMLSDAEEMVAWGDEEDDVDAMTGPIKSKNEIKDLPLVPPVTATLQPHHQTLPVGTILSIMGAQVVVEGVDKHNPLSEGSILWITQSRSPLGIVDEIFGPVKNPYYVVRYNAENEIPTGIEQGTLISFVHEFANHVLNDKSLYQNGYDASNENDEELSEELEFSDDEKEAEYKRMLKMKKRGTNESKQGKKRNDKRQQFKNQNTNWNSNNSPEAKNPSGIENRPIPPVPTTSNQENYLGQWSGPNWNSNNAPEARTQLGTENHPIPPILTSFNQESHSGPSGPAQGSGLNHLMVPPFPFNAPGPNFGGPNGILGQNVGFPGAMPRNALPWMQQNNPNHVFQTPLPTGMMMPQQQRLNTIPGFPNSFNPSCGLPNFAGAQGLAPWPACLDPNVLQQLQFGMGFQAQPASMPVNVGGEGTGPFHGGQNSQNGSEPSHVPSGGFNRGRGGGGRRGYYRGRGRGGGGRGRN